MNTSWTEKDGLPSSTVFALAQDRDGYLWAGSVSGLIRFDGVRFVRWEALGGQPLPEKIVRALCASQDGSMWIGFANLSVVARVQHGPLQVYGSAEGLSVGGIHGLLPYLELN